MTKENNEKKEVQLWDMSIALELYGVTHISFPFFFKFSWDEPLVPYLF